MVRHDFRHPTRLQDLQAPSLLARADEVIE
jgi:hypothetical protein